MELGIRGCLAKQSDCVRASLPSLGPVPGAKPGASLALEPPIVEKFSKNDEAAIPDTIQRQSSGAREVSSSDQCHSNICHWHDISRVLLQFSENPYCYVNMSFKLEFLDACSAGRSFSIISAEPSLVESSVSPHY